MRWIKKGLIYGPNATSSWAKHSALQPTPIIINKDTIRVFVGFRDAEGCGRVGFLDLDGHNPSFIKYISEEPVLDIGEPGTFDENGVIPCAIVRRQDELFLYYAGYQLGKKVRFYGFTGMAISKDNGRSFIRYSKAPIIDRTDEALYFRAIHSIFFENGIWRVWYGAGSQFIQGNEKTLPVYDIRYMESKDGINFPKTGKVVVGVKGGDEHRVGRPYVIKHNNVYKMFYGVGTKAKGYRLGYAESEN